MSARAVPPALEMTDAELAAMRAYTTRLWPAATGADPWDQSKQPTTGDVLTALSYAFSYWITDHIHDKDAVPEFMHRQAMFSVLVGQEMGRRNEELSHKLAELTKENAGLRARVQLACLPPTPPRPPKKARVMPPQAAATS